MRHLFRARTIESLNTGYSQIKVTKFNQREDDLCLLIDRLRRFGCLSYEYLHLEVQGDELTLERDRLPGSALDELLEYNDDIRATLAALMYCYRQACDTFSSTGFGFICTDYKELSNVMYDPVYGSMQLIDFEDSFVTTTDRDLFDQYWALAQEHADMEFRRLTLLSRL